MEIESAEALSHHLTEGKSLSGLRLQDLDLSGSLGQRLVDDAPDAHGLVVLGGIVPATVSAALVARGAVVFPADPALPVDPYRATLYSPEELYAGWENDGYATTPDARAYAWTRHPSTATDAYATAMQSLHDAAVLDALQETVAGRSTVGVMGGHGLGRDAPVYRDVARLGHRLAEDGHLVLTGGGPGAMEAANLGAASRGDQLEQALDLLAEGPASYTPEIDSWVRSGFTARDVVRPSRNAPARTIGIPTWFYGHEPPNVFGDAVAKFFSNAVREDQLLGASHDAIIVLEGAAGTVQEIFQAATPMYYATDDTPLPHLVLVGRTAWTHTVPVWDALRALAVGRRMEDHLHLVDTIDEAADLVPTC